LAAAIARSADATSGRRSSKALGATGGIAGTGTIFGLAASVNCGAGTPTNTAIAF